MTDAASANWQTHHPPIHIGSDIACYDLSPTSAAMTITAIHAQPQQAKTQPPPYSTIPSPSSPRRRAIDPTVPAATEATISTQTRISVVCPRITAAAGITAHSTASTGAVDESRGGRRRPPGPGHAGRAGHRSWISATAWLAREGLPLAPVHRCVRQGVRPLVALAWPPRREPNPSLRHRV